MTVYNTYVLKSIVGHLAEGKGKKKRGMRRERKGEWKGKREEKGEKKENGEGERGREKEQKREGGRKIA